MHIADKKILILGAQGMLGHALQHVFPDAILWDKAELDITNAAEVVSKITELAPNGIINAAAYTDVDGAEVNQEIASAINGTAVGYIAQAAKKIGAVLVHYSTDYVFAGTQPNGYDENAKPSPVNAYGHSKLLGEQELQKHTDQFYLIRTSWLYGKYGKNFVSTILRIANERGELQVVNDQFGRPTYTVDLAQQTKKLLDDQAAFGIYHVTNSTSKAQGISWFDFAASAIVLAGVDATVTPCDTTAFPRPAQRPQYGVLQTTKNYQSRDWQQALEQYIANDLDDSALS